MTGYVSRIAGSARPCLTDTVRGSPGADDNGTGIAGLLEISRLLAGHRFRRSVVLAATDFEEFDVIGSRHLVPWLTDRYRVLGAIVYDSIGYTDRTPGAQHIPFIVGPVFPQQMSRLRRRGNAADMVCSIYRSSSLPLVRRWARCLAATVGRDRILLLRDPLDLPLIGRLLARIPGAGDFSRSDHVSFWRAGIPAIHVNDTANFRNPH
jgi:Zn-dependent M28 family amino/carboxypeptidase